jgi:hypothetical protein
MANASDPVMLTARARADATRQSNSWRVLYDLSCADHL